MRKPNILLIMVDQLAAPALPVYGHRIVKAPNIDALAARGTVFENAYCNFPICAPSRYSMLAGRLPWAIGAYDNATELPASTPTIAHYLRALGYSTALCGKMHFIGPDQLHGFEERLTTDIYPSDFAWTPNWLEGPANKPTGVSMRGVIDAGKCVRSLQIDYDDEVEYHGLQKIYDLARADDQQPFFLVVSFTHPHSPFVTSERHWNLYRHDDIDMPRVAPIPLDRLDEHSRWLYYAHGRDLHAVTDAHVRNARHAYYGMISYVDEKIGRIMQALDETGLRDDTAVVLAGDHGEMLGERGMWYKQTFFEWSARVPLVIAPPGRAAPRRVPNPVSLVDLMPTLLDFAGDGAPVATVDPMDGCSLAGLASGSGPNWSATVISEYTSEGVCSPSRMIRRGCYKYVMTRGAAPMLFDLDVDPDELVNLAGKPSVSQVENTLRARLLQDWDPDALHASVLESQKRRLFLQKVAAASGKYPNWAYQPYRDESKRYVRGGGAAGPMGVKSRARFPYVDPTA